MCLVWIRITSMSKKIVETCAVIDELLLHKHLGAVQVKSILMLLIKSQRQGGIINESLTSTTLKTATHLSHLADSQTQNVHWWGSWMITLWTWIHDKYGDDVRQIVKQAFLMRHELNVVSRTRMAIYLWKFYVLNHEGKIHRYFVEIFDKDLDLKGWKYEVLETQQPKKKF